MVPDLFSLRENKSGTFFAIAPAVQVVLPVHRGASQLACPRCLDTGCCQYRFTLPVWCRSAALRRMRPCEPVGREQPIHRRGYRAKRSGCQAAGSPKQCAARIARARSRYDESRLVISVIKLMRSRSPSRALVSMECGAMRALVKPRVADSQYGRFTAAGL